MWRDPIVAEIRSIRESIAAEHNFDIAAICRAARERQKSSGHKIVSQPLRRLSTKATVGRGDSNGT